MPLLERSITALGDQAEVIAQMSIGNMWDRLLGEFLGEWDRLQRRKLPAAEMERELSAFLDNLSEKPVEDLARRSTSVAYNQGRGASITDARLVQYVVRSEVLDERTCEACAGLDGLVVEVGSADFDRWMPPAGCLGGDRCRGFFIPVTEELIG